MTDTSTTALPGDAVAALEQVRHSGFNIVARRFGESVTATLIDTFDGAICRSGRVLVDIGGVWTLYSPNGAVLRQSVGPVRFLHDLASGPVADALAGVSHLRAFLRLVSVPAVEAELSLTDNALNIRARIDAVVFGEGGGMTTLAARSVERGGDSVAEMLAAAVAWQKSRDLRTIYDAFVPDLIDYVAKPALAIEPAEPIFDVAARIISAHLSIARANEPGVVRDIDTEFLHDYRVALRKIRSVVSLFNGVYPPELTDRLKAAFSGLMAPTGALRDLDVYLLGRDDYAALIPTELQSGLGVMFGRFSSDRGRVFEILTDHLTSDAYAAEIGMLEEMFACPARLDRGPEADRPSGDFAGAKIWKRYRKVRGIARRIDDATPDERVHELRIQCKKLRYLMEFFTPLFNDKNRKGAFKDVLKHLKKLQENLGLFNDYSVQQAALRDFAARSEGERRSGEIRQSVDALVAVLHGKQLAERARVSANIAEFDNSAVQEEAKRIFKGNG